MTLRRPLLGLLLLALTLALPIHGWAQGTMARIADVLVICTSAGVEETAIDWRGEKVDLLPGCPDCLPAGGLATLAEPGVPASPSGVALRLTERPHRLVVHAHAPGLHWPRAPPSERYSKRFKSL